MGIVNGDGDLSYPRLFFVGIHSLLTSFMLIMMFFKFVVKTATELVYGVDRID
jgi:hypothetical protein